MKKQLPINLMKKAVKGVSYLGHPIRLRIVEFLDIYQTSSVLNIAKSIKEEQLIVSQNLKKLKDAGLVRCERKGKFIFYSLDGEYPASLFNCIRKLYGYIANSYDFLVDNYKAILPRDFTMMVANQIKLFCHIDKMRILEFLAIFGESCVSDISKGVNIEQMKLSQYLKRLKDDGFVVSRRDGRHIYYDITTGIHKTIIKCMHNKFEKNL